MLYGSKKREIKVRPFHFEKDHTSLKKRELDIKIL